MTLRVAPKCIPLAESSSRAKRSAPPHQLSSGGQTALDALTVPIAGLVPKVRRGGCSSC